MNQHLVFVYGTLRRGYGNHHLLAQGARLLGRGRTAQHYALYALEIPFAVKGQAVSPIRGELYTVNSQCLAALDDLEEHPHWYRREEVEVAMDDGRALTAWLYFYPRAQGRLIPSGDYADFIPPAAQDRP